MRKLTGLALMTSVCLFGVARAADDHGPTNEDLRHVRAIAQPKLSPDGTTVLVQITDATADGGRSHLWLVDIAGNRARQLTYSRDGDRRGESSGEWMPDGKSILFLAHRGEHTQLFRLPMDGGEAQPYDIKIAPVVDESAAPDAIPPVKTPAVTQGKPQPIEADVQRYVASPDGKRIAIVARDPETPGEKKQHDAKADAVVVDRDQHATRLYLLDPDGGKLTPTAVVPDVERIAWSRDSDRLLAISAPMNNQNDIAPDSRAWVLTVSDPEHPKQVYAAPKTIGAAVWSFDGKDIYLLAQAKADAPPGYSDLYRLSLADERIDNLSDGFHGTIAGEPLPTNDGVLQLAQLGTRTTLVRVRNGKTEPLQFDTGIVSQVDTNAKQTRWVWIGASSDRPPTLFWADALEQHATALKTPDLIPSGWVRVQSQVVTWKSDAFTIEGLLYLPPQAAHQKVPLVVDVHGGPTGAWQDSWIPFTQFLVGQGWAVLRPNPRGSTGYGAAFAAANKDDMGGGDYRDIIAGVDAVVATYPIDGTKLALMGYSYGGEMAAFVEGRSDRFNAIVSGAPVIDQQSEYGTERDSWYDRWFYGGHPWEHPESAWRQSALAMVAHAKTPFLLLQGQSDRTDPPGQSEEMYRALRQMGVPVELVEYPREDHGPLASGMFGSPSPEPWHGFDARQRVVAFINKAFGR